ncbi:MAG: 16S rRNA (cytosine(1402)-N(4))-methyltransferase RsmH, partial [Acidobacteria bacterium]|nr:16S rRNA (cytosine(1402)-N(4))-methyltransferase RsmH [Acidobacteriota bacterium]
MLHVPVLLEETLAWLGPSFGGRDGLLVDCTVGLGGHAEAFLERHPRARLVGVDRDPEALRRSAERLAPFADRVRWIEGNFHRLDELLAQHGLERPAGILADLGVSSMQLDRPERGFSFRFDGPLDMRMGADGPTAADIVNRYPEADLERIFREYGEERQARRIARAIVAERVDRPFASTGQLRATVIRAKGGAGGREGRVDPATRTFQALRIEVNEELAGLER